MTATGEDYNQPWEKMPEAFVHFRAVTNSDGTPADYIILAVNPAFAILADLPQKELAGKSILALKSRTIDGGLNWKTLYEALVGTEKPAHPLEFYNPRNKRYYEITAWSDRPGYLAAIFLDVTVRKNKVKKLRENELRFRSLVTAMETGLVVEDSERNIVLTNQAFCDFFAIPAPPEALIGTNCSDAAEQAKELLADPDLFPRRIKEIISERKLVVNEKIHFADGKIYERDYIPVFTDDESFVGHMWQYRDITARKEAEAELRRNEELYRTVVETQKELICRYKPDTTLTFANKAYLDYFDLAEKDIGRLKYLELVPEEEHPGIQEHIQKLMKSKETLTYEHEVISGDKSKRVWQRWTDYPILDAAGKVIEFQSHGYDITEIKEALLELEAVKSFNESIVQHISEGIIISDLKGNVTFANPALLNMLGYSSEEFIGSHWTSVVPAEYHRLVEAANARRLKGKADRYELIFKHEKGTQLPCQVSGSPYHDHATGEVAGTIAVLTDISELKKAQNEINEKNRFLEQLNLYTLKQTEKNSLDDLIELIVEQLVDFTGATAAIYCEYAGTAKELHIKKIKTEQSLLNRAVAITGRKLLAEPIPVSDDFRRHMIGEVVETYPSLHEATDGAINKNTAKRLNQVFNLKSYIALAFSVEDQLYGTAALCFSTDQVERYKQFLRSFAYITAISLRRTYSEEDLRYISLHDRLTGLYNRHFFEAELARLSSSRENPITVISADLDGLKLINDTLGHAEGDRYLQAGAKLLKSGLRSSDILARVGGDEFALILPQFTVDAAEKLVQRIRANIDHYNHSQTGLPLSISIGFAVSKQSGSPLEETYRLADNAMYRDKLQRSKSARTAIINSLLRSLYECSNESEFKNNQVQKLSAQLGRSLGLNSSQIADIKLLARVRDLGNITLPPQLLHKSDKLTEEEFALIRRHSEAGYRIASAAPELAGVADLVLHHHENYDGGGYPLGITGEEIPLECRIVAICAAYSAMVNPRSYAATLTAAQALAELKRCSGTQFDPHLVDIFSDMLTAGNNS